MHVLEYQSLNVFDKFAIATASIFGQRRIVSYHDCQLQYDFSHRVISSSRLLVGFSFGSPIITALDVGKEGCFVRSERSLLGAERKYRWPRPKGCYASYASHGSHTHTRTSADASPQFPSHHNPHQLLEGEHDEAQRLVAH